MTPITVAQEAAASTCKHAQSPMEPQVVGNVQMCGEVRKHTEVFLILGWQRTPSELLQDNAYEALNRWCDLTKDTLGLQVSIVLEEQWAHRGAGQNYTPHLQSQG